MIFNYKSYKKSIRTAFIITPFIALLLAGCSDDALDTVPETSISTGTAFSTPAKILAQVNGLYGQFSNPSFYGGRYIIFNEQRGNEFSQNDGNNSTGANVWNQSITASGDFVNSVWSVAYTTINFSNILIDNLATSTVVTEDLRKNYIAEAKFIRAISYFSLVQTYAKPYAQNSAALALPLRLKGNSSGGLNDLAFSSVADVYTQIIKDLDEAEADLPDSYATAIVTASRAHKATAIALKTRVYLSKGDYPKVISEAGKLVPESAPFQYVSGSLTHRLEPNVATVYGGSYVGNEAIFSIPFTTAAEAPGLQSALSANYLTPVLYFNSSGIIADNVFSSALSTDARKALVITNGTGQKLLNKFKKSGAPFTDYVPVIRYAEVLLNYAEAAAQNENLPLARNLLTAVRNRSDAAYVFTTGIAGKEELITTILNERRIELVGEGFRTHDLVRRVQTLPGKTGNAGVAPEVLPTASNYVWAIPSNELAYNKLAPR
ncbi:RagB/SusD family nutrient uptake outer membrane protein [Flavobacterium hydrophilum]|uniref:RagB/SusD family nutrient uptake outer membrane protein n=1 Tax=Flavobacterium hydrophilum TaxID=2211445 RepID=A0A2V4C586_9FLAO|nr:RagB/SusD family nutrient uptake outer membrane protein [Flavobacterium hydrophilum]PXY46137.1 RagB/SusD family nutrient uptake outer membrane protein [Flavobacterium hydrophilum]